MIVRSVTCLVMLVKIFKLVGIYGYLTKVDLQLTGGMFNNFKVRLSLILVCASCLDFLRQSTTMCTKSKFKPLELRTILTLSRYFEKNNRNETTQILSWKT